MTDDPEGLDAAETSALAAGDERALLVNVWSGQHQTFPNTPTLGERFDAHAVAAPDRIAVSCAGAELTYGELNQRANQLAHFLREAGVGPETIVGLYLERGIDLLVGLLGIIKAGGAYLPMDLAYPPDRLAYMVSDSGATIVLTSAAASGSIAAPPAVVATAAPFLVRLSAASATGWSRSSPGFTSGTSSP